MKCNFDICLLGGFVYHGRTCKHPITSSKLVTLSILHNPKEQTQQRDKDLLTHDPAMMICLSHEIIIYIFLPLQLYVLGHRTDRKCFSSA